MSAIFGVTVYLKERERLLMRPSAYDVRVRVWLSMFVCSLIA